jgi:hypothetical protein
MSKLCLIGSDNLNKIISRCPEVGDGYKYRSDFKFADAARIESITARTGSKATNNNVYIGVRSEGKLVKNANKYEVLCDNPFTDDFQANAEGDYAFFVPENVDLSRVNAITVRMSGRSGSEWECVGIVIKDHEGSELFTYPSSSEKLTVSKGGPGNTVTIFRKNYIDNPIYKNAAKKIIKIDPRIISFLHSLDGKGKNDNNPATEKQWDYFDFYTNETLRRNIYVPLFGN